MTNLQYKIINTQTEGNVKQDEFEKALANFQYRPSAIIHYPDCIERKYHILKEYVGVESEISKIEIGKITLLCRKEETDVLVEGRRSEELLSELKEKMTFRWIEQSKHFIKPGF